MQRSLWVSQLQHVDSPLQNMPLLSHLDGLVDPARLAAAFEQVVRTFDVLRTRLDGRDPQSGQWNVTLIDITALPATEIIELSRADADTWARERGRTPIDMTVCGYDSAIAVHEDRTISWYLSLHHVITDATASAMIFDATAAAYSAQGDRTEDPALEAATLDEAPRTTPHLGASYYRWARALSAGLQNPSDNMTRRSIEYWRDRTPAPRIGRLYRSVATPTPEASRLPLPLGPQVLARAEARIAADYRMLTDDMAWSTLLVTTAALYCHRVTGADRFAIGMPVHNRSDPAARGLVGPTMEVFPIDIEIERGDTFRSLHKRVGRSILTTLRHAAPGTSPAPDFEAVVNVIPRAEQVRFGSTAATTRWLHSGAIDPSHLLRVQMTGYAADVSDDELPQTGREFALDLNHGASDDQHRRRATGHFVSILSELVDSPDSPIGEQSICGPAELERLELWEQGPGFENTTPLLSARLMSALKGGKQTALATAISDGEDVQNLSGDELWQWIATTANWLGTRNVQPGDRVGIELPRSAEAVVAIMAVMAAGGSFVPLDPTQPEARRKRLAARADCVLVLSSRTEIATLRPDGRSASEFEPVARSDDDEAYLLFTSGSTGEPKGVPITHGGLARYIRFAEENYPVTGGGGFERPIAPLFSALTFDLTVTTLFMPLMAGGMLVVIGEDGPRGLSAIAARHDINWCKATPSHLELLVRMLPENHGLQTLVVGGEAFGSRLASDLLAFRSELRIFNEYGPTEAVVGCMIHQADERELQLMAEVPIGRPAPGVSLVVLDDYLQRVPIGGPGELCISHSGVTSGYLGTDSDEDLGDSPFVQIDGQRFYRSGDLVRLNENDQLIYLGRKDEQVKVGGIRLEPIEVEERLNAHPLIERSAVRLWSPSATTPATHCVRCGLPDNVPGVSFDDDQVCETCHAYERVAPITQSWFRNPDDLQAKLAEVRTRRTGVYDCLHLLSGGKDSTFALYKLVELGFHPYVLTLDNGFISEGAKENVRRSVAELGLDHEFATSESMNDIFRDSLERYSNVCHGCYKTIYTLATTRAAEIGAPLIVTGLSRGQLFETRLIPQLFSEDRFDPAAIDRAVLEARKIYHRVDDTTNRLLNTDVFKDDDVFEKIEYLDFYRYIDVELSEMLQFLDERAPWVRPPDTGRSTNCLINAAGIHTHQTEQGYHNYAVPYAWDVRLGHKTRQEAIEELDDQLDLVEVDDMLGAVRYRPRPRQILTAWIEPTGEERDLPSPAELRTFLSDQLPAHAIPAAFVEVEELPLTTNGKLDDAALPAPKRVHRPGPTLRLTATTELERGVIEVWERILNIEPIGPDDDFFALGGDSLAALEMIVALGDALNQALGEDLAFTNTSPRALAAAIETAESSSPAATPEDLARYATPQRQAPSLSSGELAVLFDQSNRPDDVMYNVGRVYEVAGSVDAERFEAALRAVAGRHQPLSWSYGATRRELGSQEAVWFSASDDAVAPEVFETRITDLHRRHFDLDDGPLLRCVIQPLTGEIPKTAIFLAVHHASGDAGSFGRLWRQIDAELAGAEPVASLDYAAYCAWQDDNLADAQKSYWLDSSGDREASSLAIHRPATPERDGFLTRTAAVSPSALRAGAGSSRAAVALAAVATTLRQYSDGPDIEIGLITSIRRGAAAEDLFGYFLNSLPVRVRCSAGGAADDTTGKATTAIAGALANRAYPLAKIVADRHHAGRPAPNLDVLMAFDELEDVTLNGVSTSQRVLSNGTAVAPLTFFIELRNDHIDLSLEYRGSACDAETAGAMLRQLDQALTCVVGATPTEAQTTPSSSLLLGPELADRTTSLERVVDHLSNGGTEPAVVCGSAQLDWRTLGKRADAVATTLLGQGVQPGDLVALCLPRSVDLLSAIIGIQLAGAAYVPVDPGYPPERIALIIGTAGATVGVVDDDHRHLVAEPIIIDDDGITTGTDRTSWQDVDSRTNRPSVPFVATDDPAYVLFTSGSTGEPRGVPVSHAMLAASTNARSGVYASEPSAFVMVSSIAFDSSIVGLFWTLAAGGTVILPTEDQAHDVPAIAELLRSGVSHTLMVPTLYQALLSLTEAGSPWPQQVIVAGEACPASLVSAHFDAFPETALTNEYGPTEATVWATAYHCAPTDEAVPIGGPIPGTWVAVVDSTGVIRTAGVEGDLIIGGLGVTEGYLNDADATDKKYGVLTTFAGAPELAGDRYFRTGDRAVVIDGLVRFLGRSDSQLNLGGTRAEPEDIEDVLLAAEGITAAVAVTADIRTLPELLHALPADIVGKAMSEAGTADDPTAALHRRLQTEGKPELRLVAHVERPTATGAAQDAELLTRLREKAMAGLPPLLRPARYELHGELPRTPNGKIDREAASWLPLAAETTGPAMTTAVSDGSPGSPASARGDIATDGSRTLPSGAAAEQTAELTARMTDLFAKALRSDRFGPDDSFFDHGGHSLLAMELLLEVEETHGLRLPAAALYAAPTPRQLAARVGQDTPEEIKSFLVPIQTKGTRPPIFAIHVLGIDSMFFRPLSARLGDDQPMYGLGQPTTDLDTAGPTEVSAVAELYATEINRVAPTGPISLAAISLGGVVAYELAQQLLRQGRDVTLLALFDALGPEAVTDGPSLSSRLTAHLERAAANPIRYTQEQRDRQGQRITRARERANLALRRRLNARTDYQLEVRRFIEDNVNAQGSYTYDAYPGDMLVIKAAEDPFATFYVESEMGWKDLAVGDLSIDVSPGGHLSMMAEPNVESVAESLKRALDAGERRERSLITDRWTVEQLLIRSLRAGRLPAAVNRIGRQASLSSNAETLLSDVDRLLADLARTTEQAAHEAAQRLRDAGISAKTVPIPRRLQHATAVIEVDGHPSIADRAMASLQYYSVEGLGIAAMTATIKATGHIDYIRRDTNTARIRLRWLGSEAGADSKLSRAGSRLSPTRRDFDVVDLPEWAWPAYWPIRPLRVARDRLRASGPDRSRRAATPANLGIFLGTPPGLIGPLLDFAETKPGQLVVDIGCGDGRVLIEAATRFSCRARGYETDPDLVAQARAAIDLAGLSEQVEVVHGDATNATLDDADVVFAFLPPEAVADILHPVLNQLPPTAAFMSHEQLAAALPHPSDRSGLVIGHQPDEPTGGGITVANLWFGRAGR